MQMNAEARAWLDAAVRRILARHPLGDPERAGVTYELMSHLHAAAEARAAAAGRTEVTRPDLEAALAEAGGESALAAAFVQPLAKPVRRATFLRRAGAFAIDALVLLLAVAFLHHTLTLILTPLTAGMAAGEMPALAWALPWGFHDPAAPVVMQLAIALASAALVMGYFTLFEGHDGRSLGKRALELRVVRVDGRPMTFREGFLRNLAKLSPPLLAADAFAMLFTPDEAQRRLSDKMADTLVVRA